MIDASLIRDLMTRLLEIAGEQGVSYFRPTIPSKTLQHELDFTFDLSAGFRAGSDPTAYLVIPHYWAAFVHDGRGPVSPVEKRVLVWFADPRRDDPRIQGGYPVRKSEIRRLTAEQYKAGLEMNRINRAAGKMPAMIVTRISGPVAANPFFEFHADGFYRHIEPILRREFEVFVRANWKYRKVVTAPEARFRLR